MNDTQLLGLRAFLWVQKFSHLRLRCLKGASTIAMLLSAWNLNMNTNMPVRLLLLGKHDNHTVGRGRYQNVYIAFYCNVLYRSCYFSFILMDVVGDANWEIGTVWSLRVNLVHCVIISACQSNVHVCGRYICLLWLLCVLRVDVSARGRSLVQGSLTESL